MSRLTLRLWPNRSHQLTFEQRIAEARLRAQRAAFARCCRYVVGAA